MKTFISALLLLCSVLVFRQASAHEDAPPVWAMTPRELIELEQSIQRHRQEFLSALTEAMEFGVDPNTLNRPYRFDSNHAVTDIPRSVLNRVIMTSLEIELATTKKYLFCDLSCDRSLEKDMGGHPRSRLAVKLIRGTWSKVKASFEILWKDIPLGVWVRLVNAAKYSRSIGASVRYQSKAYGSYSAAAGAAGFTAAFTVTEILESMYLGPAHFICKANYFWSIAFGRAIASLSRDLKTFLFFGKDGKSFLDRMLQTFFSFRDLRRTQNLENRVLFQVLIGDDDVEQYKKLTRRQSHTGVLEPLLDGVSATQAVAADALLWAEIVAAVTLDLPARPASNDTAERVRLFENEIASLFNSERKTGRALARWQDLNASLRTILKVFRGSLEVEHQLYHDRGTNLQFLGSLDMELRTLDLFLRAFLQNDQTPTTAAASSKWLQDFLSEWLSLAIAASERGGDIEQQSNRREMLQSRLDAMKIRLSQSVRQGWTIGPNVAGQQSLRENLARPRSCQQIFATRAR